MSVLPDSLIQRRNGADFWFSQRRDGRDKRTTATSVMSQALTVIEDFKLSGYTETKTTTDWRATITSVCRLPLHSPLHAFRDCWTPIMSGYGTLSMTTSQSQRQHPTFVAVLDSVYFASHSMLSTTLIEHFECIAFANFCLNDNYSYFRHPTTLSAY